ncbi:MAG: GNAT family protein [Bdellovibrionota bacterium]
MPWNLTPRTIESECLQLVPLEISLLDEMCEALLPDPNGWYQKMFGLTTRTLIEAEILESEKEERNGESLGFAFRDPKTGLIAGMSKFMRLDEENRHLEIGNTMIGPKFRRTHVNSWAKFMMLKEAFEILRVGRVSFRIDEENLISQRAVERLGARLDGILRNERILPDGRVRDYRFYSIVNAEWPTVKSALSKKLEIS